MREDRSPGSDPLFSGLGQHPVARSYRGGAAGQPLPDRVHHLHASTARAQSEHPLLYSAVSWDTCRFRKPLPALAGESATQVPAATCVFRPSMWRTPENVCILLIKFLAYIERLNKQ